MVVEYNKKTMLYEHYVWDQYEEDDPRVSGKLTEIAFNRSSGPEVLYLIHDLMISWGLEGKASGQKIERMIKNFLPYNLTTQQNVKTWIKQNWKYY